MTYVTEGEADLSSWIGTLGPGRSGIKPRADRMESIA